MSSSKPFADWDLKHKASMGEKVGKIVEELAETACVHIEERELIGWVRSFETMIPPEHEAFKLYLEEFVVNMLLRVGRQKWYRDTITDLGLALSKGSKDSQTEDTSKVLELK